MKYLYNKIYKTLTKKIEDTVNGKIACILGLILWKCPFYPKQTTIRWNPNQNTNGIFHRNLKKKNYSKKLGDPQKTMNSQNNSENKAEGIPWPDFIPHYEVIKTV